MLCCRFWRIKMNIYKSCTNALVDHIYTNVPSISSAAARPRTWQKKRRAAISNCRTVIFNVICVKYVWWDSSRWIFVWEAETGCRSSDRQVSHETDFVVVLGDICEINFRRSGINMCRSNSTVPCTLEKKIRGNIVMHIQKYTSRKKTNAIK